MSQSNDQNENPNNSPFAGMSPDKVQFLMQMMGQMNGKGAPELMRVLMGASSAAESQNLQFSDSEADQILNALLPNMSPADKQRVEMMRNISRILSMRRK